MVDILNSSEHNYNTWFSHTGPSIPGVDLQTDITSHITAFERVPTDVHFVWKHWLVDVDFEGTTF